MRHHITEAERTELLAAAVTAMRAWLGYGSEQPADKRERTRQQQATKAAVTAAVVEGGHIHTLITAQVQCQGMRVVEMIQDPDAYVAALAAERGASKNYVKIVTARMGSYARSRVGEYGDKTKFAKALGVSRVTLDEWLDQEEEPKF